MSIRNYKGDVYQKGGKHPSISKLEVKQNLERKIEDFSNKPTEDLTLIHYARNTIESGSPDNLIVQEANYLPSGPSSSK
jgi:hypothetical protein